MPDRRPLGTVAITGATSPIGSALVRALAPFAVEIVTLSRTSKLPFPAHELVAEHGLVGLHALVGDLSTPDGVKVLSDWLGSGRNVDTLVNNAGTYLRRANHDCDWQTWVDLLSVNLIAAAQLTRVCVRAGCKRIVNIAEAGWHRAWPNHSAYLASKAGLVSLTRTLATELAPDVQVNAVAPGIITLPESAAVPLEELQARIPAGRPGTPEDIAEVVASLLTGPSYVTGQVLAVDGGYSHR